MEDVDGLLTSVLSVNLTLVSVRQNEDNRKIAAWGAIGIAPTAMAGIWGMNFEHMPELDWAVGYPLALGSSPSSASCCTATSARPAGSSGTRLVLGLGGDTLPGCHVCSSPRRSPIRASTASGRPVTRSTSSWTSPPRRCRSWCRAPTP